MTIKKIKIFNPEDVDPDDAVVRRPARRRRDEVAPAPAPAVRHEDGGGPREGLHFGEVGEAAAIVALGGGFDKEVDHLVRLPAPKVVLCGERNQPGNAHAFRPQMLGIPPGGLVLGLSARLVRLLFSDHVGVGDGLAQAVAPRLRVAAPVLGGNLSRLLLLCDGLKGGERARVDARGGVEELGAERLDCGSRLF